MTADLPELDEIEALLAPFHPAPSRPLLNQLAMYLQVLTRWNARTNLTAIRDPREIVRRHFGESLFAASLITDAATLLDFGSGAGFPGLPIALFRSEIAVMLAESQHKKAAFLREMVHSLKLPTEIWPQRVEAMAAGRVFDCVTLRAVDNMEMALAEAARRASKQLIVLTSISQAASVLQTRGFIEAARTSIPGSQHAIVLQMHRVDVPRGT